MASKQKVDAKSKSGLFLMELIIAICFFSVASAVCARLFVTAHSLSKNTVNINTAVRHCRNIAEIYTATGGDISEVTAILEEDPCYLVTTSGKDITLLFDSSWTPVTDPEAAFCIRLTDTPAAAGEIAVLSVCVLEASGDVLYTLDAPCYIPLTGETVKEGTYEP